MCFFFIFYWYLHINKMRMSSLEKDCLHIEREKKNTNNFFFPFKVEKQLSNFKIVSFDLCLVLYNNFWPLVKF